MPQIKQREKESDNRTRQKMKNVNKKNPQRINLAIPFLILPSAQCVTIPFFDLSKGKGTSQ